jgi:hypothetical protein
LKQNSPAEMTIESDYSAAWRDLKKRRLVLLALFLGYVPGVFALFVAIVLPLSALTGIKSDYFIYPIALCWMPSVRRRWDTRGDFPMPALSSMVLCHLVVNAGTESL